MRARHEAAKASQRYVMDSHDYVREPLLEVRTKDDVLPEPHPMSRP